MATAKRKRKSNRDLWKLAFVCFFFGYIIIVSIFTVWSRTQAVYIDYELSELESHAKTLEKTNRSLKIEKASLENPIRIEGIAKKLNSQNPPEPD